jgi:hypothetical protein
MVVAGQEVGRSILISGTYENGHRLVFSGGYWADLNLHLLALFNGIRHEKCSFD